MLGHALLYGLTSLGMLSLLALGVSAISRKEKSTPAFWFMWWIVGGVVAPIARQTQPWLQHVSFSFNLDQIARASFRIGDDIKTAQDNIPVLGDMLRGDLARNHGRAELAGHLGRIDGPGVDARRGGAGDPLEGETRMSAIIQAVELSRWYGIVMGLNNVSFEIEPGLTGLVGPNGAGKSTLIQIITGQLQPSSGRLTVFGETPWNNPVIAAAARLLPRGRSGAEGSAAAGLAEGPGAVVGR